MAAMYAKIMTPGMWSPQGLNGSVGGLKLAPNKVHVARQRPTLWSRANANTAGVSDLNTSLTKSGDI
jgi:hypothetical protein